MNLNQKIISIQQKVESRTNTGFSDDVLALLVSLQLFNFSIFGFLLFLLINIDKNVFYLSCTLLCTSIFTFVLWKIFKETKDAKLIDGVYYYLHYIFPSKKKRNLEISEYLKSVTKTKKDL